MERSRAMLKMTKRKIEVLEFIKLFVAEKGYSPTVREISEGLFIQSSSTVHKHLEDLKTLGVIDWTPGATRTIKALGVSEPVKSEPAVQPAFPQHDHELFKEVIRRHVDAVAYRRICDE